MACSPELSIVIPAYNEERRIRPTLESLDDYLSAGGVSYEILVVDDGSTDGTVDVVRSVGEERCAVSCLRADENRGKGSAVRLGMLAARGSIRVMYDADGAIPATELPKIVNPVRHGLADVAIGSRYLDESQVERRPPLYRVLWSRLANSVVRWSLVPGIRDTQCGFKAFSRAAATRLFSCTKIDGWSFDLEVLALARRLEIDIREVAVSWSDDPRSRVSPVRDALAVMGELMAIHGYLRAGGYE